MENNYQLRERLLLLIGTKKYFMYERDITYMNDHILQHAFAVTFKAFSEGCGIVFVLLREINRKHNKAGKQNNGGTMT